jgi:hypothetical protein
MRILIAALSEPPIVFLRPLAVKQDGCFPRWLALASSPLFESAGSERILRLRRLCPGDALTGSYCKPVSFQEMTSALGIDSGRIAGHSEVVPMQAFRL